MIVLGVGHLVHPGREVGPSMTADLVGEGGVHRCLHRKAGGEIVRTRASVGRVGLLGEEGVQALSESLVAFGHRSKNRGQLGFAVDVGLLGQIVSAGHRGSDLTQAGAQRVDRLGGFRIGHRRYSRGPVTAALNVAAVRRGAIVCLIVAAPAAVISRLLAGDDTGTDQSSWVFLALLAIVAAYLLGGSVAGRIANDAPFVNGAAATLAAFVVVQVVAGIALLVQGDGLSPLGIIFNALLAATIGVVGAGIGVARANRGARD